MILAQIIILIFIILFAITLYFLFINSKIRYLFVLPFYIILLTFYINTLFIVLPYFKVISATFIISIILIIILYKKAKSFILKNILFTSFIFMIGTIILAHYNTKLYITYKAIKRFHKLPYIININVSINRDREINPPHATLFFKGKAYCWSYKDDDFYLAGY